MYIADDEAGKNLSEWPPGQDFGCGLAMNGCIVPLPHQRRFFCSVDRIRATRTSALNANLGSRSFGLSCGQAFRWMRSWPSCRAPSLFPEQGLPGVSAILRKPLEARSGSLFSLHSFLRGRTIMRLEPSSGGVEYQCFRVAGTGISELET